MATATRPRKIDFGADYGVKHLVLRYAPLEKL